MTRFSSAILVGAAIVFVLGAAAGCGGSARPTAHGSERGSAALAQQSGRGAQLFTSAGCAGCHTLRAANAHGQVGPDLDQLRPDYATVLRQVRRGGNGMPSFSGKLAASSIREVAVYVSHAAAASGALVPAAAFVPDKRLPAQCRHDFACLRQAFGNIAYRRGPQVALQQLDQLQRRDSVVAGFCHQITHEIGHAALARYHGNAAKALGEGGMTCWSGYYHGVIERAFAGIPRDRVQRTARSMCASLSAAASFVLYQCVHGLGHGLMIYSGGDLAYSLRVCDALPDAWNQTSCTGGVFMQAFLPPMPGMQSSEMQMTKRQARNLLYPCPAVAERDKLYCYLQITDRILPRVSFNWRAASDWCRRAEKAWIATCFQSLGRDISGNNNQDPVRIAQLCGLAGSGSADCIYGAVRDVAANDANGVRAAKVCLQHTALSPYRCFAAVGSILGGLSTTRAGRRSLCAAVTPPAHRQACFNGAGAL
jgi:mono/diheme cytochrome c family protein